MASRTSRSPESESAFQDAVAEFARTVGWRVAHFRPGAVRNGKFVTPVQYDGAGFPDLVMTRRGAIVFAELKRKGVRRISDTQGLWRDELVQAMLQNPLVAYRVWNPLDWDDIEAVLR